MGCNCSKRNTAQQARRLTTAATSTRTMSAAAQLRERQEARRVAAAELQQVTETKSE